MSSAKQTEPGAVSHTKGTPPSVLCTHPSPRCPPAPTPPAPVPGPQGAHGHSTASHPGWAVAGFLMEASELRQKAAWTSMRKPCGPPAPAPGLISQACHSPCSCHLPH